MGRCLFILGILWMLMPFVSSFGQTADSVIALEGVVRDSLCHGIEGVEVRLQTPSVKVYTDKDGKFAFKRVNPGKHKLYLSKEGYKDLKKSVELRIGNNSPLSITLLKFSSELDQVVVTGMYEPAGLQKSIYRVRVIDRASIERRHATDILDVLRTISGIRMTTDQTLGETDISLLGMGGENIKVLLDGVPLLDRGATRNSLSQIDLHSIQRIEIVEGPLSVMYGADALAGVINIITKTETKMVSAGKRNSLGHIGIGLNLQEQTVGKEYKLLDKEGQHNGNLSLRWQKGKVFADASLTRNNFGGWRGPAAQNEGKRGKAWLPKDQWLAGGRVGFNAKKWSGWYRYLYLQEDIWALGEENTNTDQATDQEFMTDRSAHQLHLGWTPRDIWRLSLDGAYQLYSRRTRTTIVNTETGVRNLVPDPGLQEVSDFNSGFARVSGHHKFSSTLEGLLGIELTHETGSGPRIEGSPSIDNYSLFLSGEYKPAPWAALRPGVRFSKNSIYDAPPVIPAFNAKFNLDHALSLRLSYARGFRAPALRELYFWFFDANHSIKGNENLKAEFSHSFSVSLAWQHLVEQGVQVSADLNAFYNQFHNRIEMALDPSLGTNVYSYINLAKYKTTGLSLNGHLQKGRFLGSIGFSYVGKYNAYHDQATYRSDRLPLFVWSPEVNADLSYLFSKPQLELSLQYKFTGTLSRYEIDEIDGKEQPFLAQTGAFHWLDFSVSKRLIKSLAITAGVKNIFDVTDLDNTSMGGGEAHSSGGPLPMGYGRSYFAGISWRWP